MDEPSSSIHRLAALVAEHAIAEGRTPTSIEGVDVFRADKPSDIRCVIYHPCIIIVAQGRKRATVGNHRFEYSPARYLVLPVSLPINSQVLEASPESPFLSFSIRVEPTALAEIASLVDQVESDDTIAARGIAVSDTGPELLDASIRLLSCLSSDVDSKVLAPQIVREILYRVLTGPQGGLLRGLGSRSARLNQVSRALSLIHNEYERPIEVAEMAAAASMSESTFYAAFKSVTSHSPLQYVKEIRLNRARQLILWEHASAKQAATRVGYESASQFSREFRRRFGRPPVAERKWAIETGELTGVRPY